MNSTSAAAASTHWKLEDGDFTYIDIAFTDDAIIYNPDLVPTLPPRASDGRGG
jgi:hypothetical protein